MLQKEHKKNGKNIKAFLKDYLSPELKEGAFFLRAGFIHTALDIEWKEGIQEGVALKDGKPVIQSCSMAK